MSVEGSPHFGDEGFKAKEEISPEELYINKKLEKNKLRKLLAGRKARKELLKVQHESLNDKGEYPPNGEIQFDQGNYHYSLVFNEVNQSDPLYYSNSTRMKEGRTYSNEFTRRFREVSQLELTDETKTGREKWVFNLNDELPIFCGVYIEPQARGVSGANDVLNDLILVRGNPETPLFFVTFLHELGHLKRNHTRNDREEITNLFKMLNSDDKEKQRHAVASLLNIERDAWAYALNKLRPILSREKDERMINREDVLKSVDYCLSTHSVHFREVLSQNVKEFILSFFE